MPLIIQYFLLALGPALAQGRATCKEAGCSGHGSCGLLGSCLCEGSWAGRDCSFQLSLDGDDDLVSLTADDSQESPDDDTDVLFGPSSTIAEPPPLAVDFLALRPGSARAQANRENTPYETDVLLDPPSAIPAPPAPVEFLALRPGSSSAQAKSAGSPKKTSHQLARDAWAAADRLFAAAQVENARDASQRVKRAILLARSKKGSIPGHEFAGLQATSAKGSANGTTRSCAMDCSSRGLCLSGSCVCNSGFFGKGCESVRCADDCSGNGYCYQGLCQCNGNYSGANCAAKAPAASTFASLLSTGLEAEKASKQQAKQQPEVKTCPLGCSGRGTCSAGICACNEPWAGRACEDAAVVAFAEDAAVVAQLACLPDAVCSSNGVCQLGRCQCNQGFSGQACEQRARPVQLQLQDQLQQLSSRTSSSAAAAPVQDASQDQDQEDAPVAPAPITASWLAAAAGGETPAKAKQVSLISKRARKQSMHAATGVAGVIQSMLAKAAAPSFKPTGLAALLASALPIAAPVDLIAEDADP
mmetsp:Transcript_51687/g.83858  ORF Transcript_51687/g.83858 Transcript_51687/m.83858 type:complete len:530 (+) Transcript_51687:162-1751(+)